MDLYQPNLIAPTGEKRPRSLALTAYAAQSEYWHKNIRSDRLRTNFSAVIRCVTLYVVGNRTSQKD